MLVTIDSAILNQTADIVERLGTELEEAKRAGGRRVILEKVASGAVEHLVSRLVDLRIVPASKAAAVAASVREDPFELVKIASQLTEYLSPTTSGRGFPADRPASSTEPTASRQEALWGRAARQA